MSKQRLIDADALYNGAMKDEYFDYVEHDNHGRESFAYSCAMQRLAEAPTIDAIPVEWLRRQYHKYMQNNDKLMCDAYAVVIGEWQDMQKEQEART